MPNGSILGIDNSEEMIHFARKKFPQKRFPNLIFEIMDARNLRFKDKFDIIFSNASLHWTIDHLPILEGIERCLEPLGKVFLQMAGKGSGSEIVEVMETNLKSKKWRKYFIDFSSPHGFYGPEEYKRWLKNVDLKAKRVELMPRDMIHKGIEELKSWIRTTWLPYTQRVPEYIRQEFIDDMVNRYVNKYPPDSNGFIHVHLIRLDVEAEKR